MENLSLHMFVCQRCGRCCIEIVDSNIWLGDLTWEQKQVLVAERKKYPSIERTTKIKGCNMVYFENNLAYCLVREVFGWEFTPKACRDYPVLNTKCINGVLRKGE